MKAIRMINSARPAGASPVTVDLHPNRPEFRGINAGGFPITLEADPTFDEVEQAGGIITKNADAHTALDDTFFISGEIPRVTPYEQGIPGGIRLDKADGEWQPDPLIMEERFTMVNLKGALRREIDPGRPDANTAYRQRPRPFYWLLSCWRH